MKHVLLAFLFLLGFAKDLPAQKNVLFSLTFVGNGEDGLHLAYSYDGLIWKALKNNIVFLTVTVGEDKLMHDPCIILAQKGNFIWLDDQLERERNRICQLRRP